MNRFRDEGLSKVIVPEVFQGRIDNEECAFPGKDSERPAGYREKLFSIDEGFGEYGSRFGREKLQLAVAFENGYLAIKEFDVLDRIFGVFPDVGVSRLWAKMPKRIGGRNEDSVARQKRFLDGIDQESVCISFPDSASNRWSALSGQLTTKAFCGW